MATVESCTSVQPDQDQLGRQPNPSDNLTSPDSGDAAVSQEGVSKRELRAARNNNIVPPAILRRRLNPAFALPFTADNGLQGEEGSQSPTDGTADASTTGGLGAALKPLSPVQEGTKTSNASQEESAPSANSQDADSQPATTTKSPASRGRSKTESGALRIDGPEWDEEVQRTLPPASYGMQAKHANFAPMVFRVCFKCNKWTRRGKNLILERGKYCCMRKECQEDVQEYEILYRPLSGFFNQKSQCGSCGIACTIRNTRAWRIVHGYKCCEWKSCDQYLQTLEKGSTSGESAQSGVDGEKLGKPKRKAQRKSKPDAEGKGEEAPDSNAQSVDALPHYLEADIQSPDHATPPSSEADHATDQSPEADHAIIQSPEADATTPSPESDGNNQSPDRATTPSPGSDGNNQSPVEGPGAKPQPKPRNKRQPKSQMDGNLPYGVKRRRKNAPTLPVGPEDATEMKTECAEPSPKPRRGANIPGVPHSWFNVNVGSRYAVPPVGGKWKGKIQVPDDDEEDRISPVLQRELDRNIPEGMDLTIGDNVEVAHAGKVYLLCSVCEGWTLKERTTKEHEKFSACKRPKCIVKSEATMRGFIVGGRPPCGFFTYRTPEGLRCQSCGRENKEFRSINGYRVCDLTPCKVYAISLPEYQDEQWKKIRPVVFNTMDCSKRGVKKKVGFTAARAAKRTTPTAKSYPTTSAPSTSSVPAPDIFTGEARKQELQRLRNFASEARMTADRLARAMPIMQRKVAAGMPPLPQKSALIFSNEEFAEFVTFLESLAIKSQAKPICAKRLHLKVAPDSRPSELTHVIEGELSDLPSEKRSFHLSFVEQHRMWGICDGGKKYVLSRIDPVLANDESDVAAVSLDASYDWDKILAAMTHVSKAWSIHCVLTFRSFPVPKPQHHAHVGFVLDDNTVAPTDAPEMGIVKTVEREIENVRAYKEVLWSGRQDPECDVCHKVRPGSLCGNASVLACTQWLCKACKKAQNSAPEPKQLPNWIDESKVDQFLPHRVLVTAPPPGSFLAPPAGFPPFPSALAGAPQYTPLQTAPPPQQIAPPPFAFGNYANTSAPPWQPEYAKSPSVPPWQVSRPWGPFQEARTGEYPEDERREAHGLPHVGEKGKGCEGKGGARPPDQGHRQWEPRKGGRDGKGWREYSDQRGSEKGQSGDKGQWRETKGRGRGERPADKSGCKGQRSQSYSLASDSRHEDARWQRDRGREHAYRDKRSPEEVCRSPSPTPPESTCEHCRCALADWMRTNGRFAEAVCDKPECMSRYQWRGEVTDATPPAVTHFFVPNEHVTRLLGKDALLPRDAAVREQSINAREHVTFQLLFVDGKPVATNVRRV